MIGNGFDLSLKMKTSYHDFAGSKFWPFADKEKYAESSLPYFLNNNYDKAKSWFDLEELLAIYASSSNIENNIHKGDSSFIEKDKDYFNILVASLTDYLLQEQDNFVERMRDIHGARRASVPHILLQMLEKKESLSIFSFNYTNLHLLARQFLLGFDADIHYVHGSLRDNDIILGAGDARQLDENYFDFYKSVNERYKSPAASITALFTLNDSMNRSPIGVKAESDTSPKSVRECSSSKEEYASPFLILLNDSNS